ncbi:LrgB family protein [Nocardioides marmoriginsengisoli]|uniref:LrgB family protein n=1 Tax=Nocardioides marmoriginsengisoli TaxID=661483 RepID=A0A3N0CD03_9ACTN|nr:LrgB family protein [Nocardioides marmoriginsengisoli]RNL61111.1 LrgB family protein [Nocardioides marmoriginsengisoli]
MSLHAHETWEWLIASPLFGITLTLAAYACGRYLHRRTASPVFQPVLVAIVMIVVVLEVGDIDYADYLAGGDYIAFWLGAATVALALPLHHEWHLVRRALAPIAVGVVVGAVVSISTALFVTDLAGGNRELQLTMAPKAATTPVSLALSAQIGGIPALTAAVTIVAGITAAILGPWILDRIGVHDLRARGIAIGSTAHGIGTSRALQESRTEGAFSALCMGLTAVVTSVLVPLLVQVL